MFLVDFDWFRTFSEDANTEYPPIDGGFMFSIIGRENYVGIGFAAYSIVINLKIGELTLQFAIQ